jgi:hypothetical protein
MLTTIYRNPSLFVVQDLSVCHCMQDWILTRTCDQRDVPSHFFHSHFQQLTQVLARHYVPPSSMQCFSNLCRIQSALLVISSTSTVTPVKIFYVTTEAIGRGRDYLCTKVYAGFDLVLGSWAR